MNSLYYQSEYERLINESLTFDEIKRRLDAFQWFNYNVDSESLALLKKELYEDLGIN